MRHCGRGRLPARFCLEPQCRVRWPPSASGRNIRFTASADCRIGSVVMNLQSTFACKPRCRALQCMSATEVDRNGVHLRRRTPSQGLQTAIAIEGELQNQIWRFSKYQSRIRLQHISCLTERLESMPSGLFPPARRNCSCEVEDEQRVKLDGAVEARAELQIQLDESRGNQIANLVGLREKAPLRSRPAGSIGLCGRSYCRRPSSGSGREPDCKSSLSEAELRQRQQGDCKLC